MIQTSATVTGRWVTRLLRVTFGVLGLTAICTAMCCGVICRGTSLGASRIAMKLRSNPSRH